MTTRRLAVDTTRDTLIIWLMLAALAVGTASGYWRYLAVLTGFAVVTLVIHRYPTFTIVCYFVAGILPNLFLMTSAYDPGWGALGRGLTAVDLVYFGMLAAVVAKAVAPRPFGSEDRPKTPAYLVVPISAFFFWCLFEIVRNLGIYHISALGEFRFRYLPIAVPLYIATFFRTRELQKRLFLMILAMSVVVVLALVPVIGLLKGWSVGPFHRFYHAYISLGLMYGIVAWLLARRRGLVRTGWWPLGIAAVLAFSLILADSHRSVWLAALVSCLLLVILRELPSERLWHWGGGVLMTLLTIMIIASAVGMDPIHQISSRAEAYFQPTKDPTSYWRLELWKAELKKAFANPMAGEGFGGYWSIYVPELGSTVTVAPHSLYVQTLVKLGVAGLLLYAMFVISSAVLLWKALHRNPPPAGFDRFFILFGLVILIASHVFFAVYSIEFYTGMWVGLGIAAALNRPQVQPESPA
jgi:O-antigen ligase